MLIDVNYYNERKELIYYQQAIQAVNQICKEGGSVLDVGCRTIPFVNWLPENFINKTVIDIKPYTPFANTNCIIADFLTYEFNEKFDLVCCLQTLEHITDPKVFAERLFRVAKKAVLITVPYRWKEGNCKYHLHDPVDENKLKQWTSREPVLSKIATENNGIRRLISGYKLPPNRNLN